MSCEAQAQLEKEGWRGGGGVCVYVGGQRVICLEWAHELWCTKTLQAATAPEQPLWLSHCFCNKQGGRDNCTSL